MIDSDLARLYDVAPKVLNQSVKRHRNRFPTDFMFQLTREEWVSLRSQIVTLETSGRGRYSKYLPCAFTEQGVAMLSSVLNSERAVETNILIIRAFVKIRALISEHADLVKRLDKMESNYDQRFRFIFDAIRQLLTPKTSPKPKIGFIPWQRKNSPKTGTQS